MIAPAPCGMWLIFANADCGAPATRAIPDKQNRPWIPVCEGCARDINPRQKLVPIAAVEVAS